MSAAAPVAPSTVLIINPNTSEAVTYRLKTLAEQRLRAQVEAVTATFGAAYISNEVAYAIAGHAVLKAWEDVPAPHTIDAILIGCFGDPGLFALREMAQRPVTGLAEAAMTQANALGPYAIVTGGAAWGPMLQRLANTLPCGHNLKDIHTVEMDGASLSANPQRAARVLVEACLQVLSCHEVESIVIGGAGLAGMAELLQPQVPVPLIDSVQAGLAQVGALAQRSERLG